MCPFSDLCLITFTVLISKRTWYRLNKTFKTISYHYHFFMIITLAWILHSHISFMLFHVPGMILKMILINPTWIFGIIPGVLKTILAISREVYYFPSPGRHFRGQPATCWPVHHTACPPVHRDGQGQLNLVPSSGHNNTSAMKVLVVTRELQYKLRRLKSAEISFLHIQKM